MRRNILFPLFGDGIFTQEGPDWKHSRDSLRPQFTYKQYEDLEIFREHVDNLIDCISASNGDVVDLQPLFFSFTLDTTTAFLFGESVNCLKSEDHAAGFAEAFNIAQAYGAKRFRLLDLYWRIGGRKFRDACTSVHQFADDILTVAWTVTRSVKEKKVDMYFWMPSRMNIQIEPL
jgi:cytochrome P450